MGASPVVGKGNETRQLGESTIVLVRSCRAERQSPELAWRGGGEPDSPALRGSAMWTPVQSEAPRKSTTRVEFGHGSC